MPAPPITVSPSSATLEVGETLQLVVDPSGGVKWRCSNCAIALVARSGLVTAIAEGVTIITATRGNQSAATTITVEGVPVPPPLPNQPPTAVLRLEFIGTVSEGVQVNTTGSTDVDGVLVGGSLDWGDGSPLATWPNTPPSLMEYFYAAAGVYEIILTIVDNEGATAVARLTVTVSPDPPPDPPPTNQPPVVVVNYLAGQYAGQPYTVSLVGTEDVDGVLQSGSVNWGDGSAPTTWLGAAPASASHTYAAAGSFTITVSATDDGGLTSTATRVAVIEAQPTPNQAPTAVLTFVTGIYVGDLFQVSTAGTFDPDGSIVSGSVDWGDGTSDPFSGPPSAVYTHVYTASGSRTIRLTVQDNGGLTATASVVRNVLTVPPPTGGQNAYFDSLVQRADTFRAFSLRDNVQLLQYRQNSGTAWVTYDSGFDAAKVTVPIFNPQALAALTAGVGSSGDLSLSVSDAVLTNGRALKVDNEIVVVQKASGVVTGYLRGQMGTTAAAHAQGTPVFAGVNSLLNQVRPPIGTTDTADYLFTWDARYTDSWQFGKTGFVGGHKTFQIARGGIWYEIQSRWDQAGGGELAKVTARGYGVLGGGVSDDNPLSPQANPFALVADRWVRYWAQVRLSAGTISLWCADTTQGVVQLLNGLAMGARANAPTAGIEAFYLEFNTSTNTMDPQREACVAYVRNLWVGRNVASVAPLLVTTGL